MPRDVSYLDIADALTAQLSNAPAGARVASEHSLMAVHGVSRPTARAALQELEQRFVVRRVRGAGTFVNRRVDYVIGAHVPPSATETFARAGIAARRRLVDVATIAASAEVARRLRIGDGEAVVEVRREISVDGVVAGVTTTRLPATLVPGLPGLLGDDVSLFHVLRTTYRMSPQRASSWATLELPPADVAERLALDSVVPSWLVESVNRDRRSGPPIEATTTWMRADVVRVVFELEER